MTEKRRRVALFFSTVVAAIKTLDFRFRDHADDRYLLVLNASNTEKDLSWLQDHRAPGVELSDVSDETALLAIQGPAALERLYRQQLRQYEAEPATAQRLLGIGLAPPEGTADEATRTAWTAVGRALLNLDETLTKG